jgi:Flp pilus assembly protein TadD
VLRIPTGELATGEVNRSLFLRNLLGLGPTEYKRALALFDAGKIEEGTRLLEDVVLLMPGNAEARTTLGEAYLSAGRAREACREFDRALAIAPQLAEAQRGASKCGAGPGAAPTS